MGIFLAVLLFAVVDRVAVVVGNNVFTETEVMQELRLEQFLNGEALDLSAKARREAAERLVDQQLIRSEMELGRYPEPDRAEADRMLQEFRHKHYRTNEAYQAALKAYGLTEDEVKQHLLWQLAAMRFTDIRFRTGLPPAAGAEIDARPPTPAPQPPGGVHTADRQVRDSKPIATSGTVDDQMAAWLKEARSRTRIDFKKEAFQ